jgi:hypothetical protein
MKIYISLLTDTLRDRSALGPPTFALGRFIPKGNILKYRAFLFLLLFGSSPFECFGSRNRTRRFDRPRTSNPVPLRNTYGTPRVPARYLITCVFFYTIYAVPPASRGVINHILAPGARLDNALGRTKGRGLVPSRTSVQAAARMCRKLRRAREGARRGRERERGAACVIPLHGAAG